MWEDKRNKAGGRWLLNFDKRRDTKEMLDSCWMETVSLVVSLPDMFLTGYSKVWPSFILAIGSGGWGVKVRVKGRRG